MVKHKGTAEAADALRVLSRAELIMRLHQLDAELVKLRRHRDDGRDGVLHELQVHQVELEMQNRELQETQSALEDSRGRYSELYHHAPTGYATVDRAGRVVEANATVCAILQQRRPRLLGAGFDTFLNAESRPEFRRCLDHCFESDHEHGAEMMLQTRGCARTVVQLTARRAQGRWGPGEHVHLSVLNVSDRRRLDEQLKFSVTVSDALFGTLDPHVVAQRVAQLAVPFLGEAATFYVRAKPQQIDVAVHEPLSWRHRDGLLLLTRALQNSPLLRTIFDEQRPLMLDVEEPTGETKLLDERARAVARELQVRALLVLPALSRREALGVLVLAQHHKGPERGHAAAFYDDFARRIGLSLDNAQLYHRSRAESQARRNLLAVVSHDLRNPLSVVMLKGEQMVTALGEFDGPKLPKLRRGADVVLRCAHRMNELIGDLLDATSMESGNFSVVARAQDLGEIVADAIEAAQESLTARKLMLSAEVDPGLEVLCDRRRTLQVLANILGNAAKFTERNGSVTVRVRGVGKFALVSVADTGGGMDAASCARVFDRFWQVHETAHLGSGLGLSICKGIVEASGGKIWVESVVGLGSTFYFTLPRTNLVLPQAPHNAPKSDEVLFVGDANGALGRQLAALLPEEGWRLTQANDSAQAIDYLARHPVPHGVVLELYAPQAHGWDFLAERETSARLRELPVLAVGHDPGAAAHVRGKKTAYLLRDEFAKRLPAQLRQAFSRLEARPGAEPPVTH